MKIRNLYGHLSFYDDFASAARYLLEGYSDGGQLEGIAERARENSECIGRLLDHLVEHNIIVSATAVEILQPGAKIEE